MIGPRRLGPSVVRRVRRELFHRLVPVRPVPGLTRLGSGYGGWTVPLDKIGPGSVCYCAGVGEDISFDLALIDATGCQVVALDPTPRAIEHVAAQAGLPPQLTFLPLGVWSSRTTLRFYEPADPSHVSHSAVNLQKTAGFFEAECDTVPGLMRALGHTRLDLLKLDVEGAEHEALKPVLDEGVEVATICVEFDQPSRLSGVLATCRKLRAAGFVLAARSGWDCTFVKP